MAKFKYYMCYFKDYSGNLRITRGNCGIVGILLRIIVVFVRVICVYSMIN